MPAGLSREIVRGRTDAAGDEQEVRLAGYKSNRFLDRFLLIRHGPVREHIAPDGGELLADPGGVGVDRLAEHQLVADAEDDRVHV